MRFLILLLLCLFASSAKAINWPDHRPIAYMNISPFCDQVQIQINNGTLKTQKDINFAFTTYAAQTIRVMQSENAQGLIVWDESNEPDNMHYVGDPRLVLRPPLTPALQKLLFDTWRTAKLRVGVCLRPGILTPRADGSGTYDRLQAQSLPEDIFAKAEYARKTWGCTLFYVDSDVDATGGAPHPGWLDTLKMWGYDPAKYLFIVENTTCGQKNPDPFWATPDYFWRASQYVLSSNKLNPSPCPGAYPGSFACCSMLGAVDHSRDGELIAFFKAGGIPFEFGWFDNGTIAWINKLEQQAGNGPATQPSIGPTTQPAN